MKKISHLAFAVMLSGIFSAVPALAHAHLEMAMPAAGSAAPSPKSIMLHFNEKIEAALSGFEVTGPDGAKADLKMTVEGAMMSAPVKGKLAPGVYSVKWWAVSADGHRMTGDHSFTVK